MRVLADGRVWRSDTEWRSILARFEKSGLSESEFCQRSKLGRSTFVKWRKRLAANPEASASFVEWTAPTPEEATSRSGEFELTLPGGVVLRWKA